MCGHLEPDVVLDFGEDLGFAVSEEVTAILRISGDINSVFRNKFILENSDPANTHHGFFESAAINEVVEFRKPKNVYIPLICGNDTDITIIPKIGSYVYKGEIVGNNKGKIKRFIHSSVSGKLKSIENKVLLDGTSVKCLIIENDFKEQFTEIKGVKKNIHDYTKKEFIEIIKKAGVVGMGGAGFPTYVKYDTTEKIKLLIIKLIFR